MPPRSRASRAVFAALATSKLGRGARDRERVRDTPRFLLSLRWSPRPCLLLFLRLGASGPRARDASRAELLSRTLPSWSTMLQQSVGQSESPLAGGREAGGAEGRPHRRNTHKKRSTPQSISSFNCAMDRAAAHVEGAQAAQQEAEEEPPVASEEQVVAWLREYRFLAKEPNPSAGE